MSCNLRGLQYQVLRSCGYSSCNLEYGLCSFGIQLHVTSTTVVTVYVTCLRLFCTTQPVHVYDCFVYDCYMSTTVYVTGLLQLRSSSSYMSTTVVTVYVTAILEVSSLMSCSLRGLQLQLLQSGVRSMQFWDTRVIKRSYNASFGAPELQSTEC